VTAPPTSRQDAKAQARRQWANDPAGALAAGDAELGSELSFARIEAHRYREQPWMQRTFRYADSAGKSVLEIGVGLGTDHLQFARAGARTTGIDLTPRCVELTRRRCEQEGVTSDLRVMDAEALDFPDDSFDVVYSFGVLHHTPDMAAAFREVRRVLRPGGSFIGGLYSRYSWFHAAVRLKRIRERGHRSETIEERLARIEVSSSDSLPLVRLTSGRELRRMLADAGFASVRLRRRHLGLASLSGRLPSPVEDLAGRLGGWYLIHDAR
jgi:ubiquinone/menaquinone biosynthesis C-methylase UbiE